MNKLIKLIIALLLVSVEGYSQYILPPTQNNIFTSNGSIGSASRVLTGTNQLAFDVPGVLIGRFARPYLSISGYGEKAFQLVTGESASLLGVGDSLVLNGNQVYLVSGAFNQFNNQPLLLNSNRQIIAPNYSLPTTQPTNGTYSLTFVNGISSFSNTVIPFNPTEIASGASTEFASTISHYICNTSTGNVTFSNVGAPSSSSPSYIHKTSTANSVIINASTLEYVYRGVSYTTGTLSLTDRNSYTIVPVGDKFVIVD